MKKFLERTEKKLDTWAVKLAGINLSYPVDLVCGILFLLIGIVLLLAMPQQVKISEKDVVNGRAFPTMLVWVMLAMSAILVGREGLNVLRHQPMRMKQLNLLSEGTDHCADPLRHLSAGENHRTVRSRRGLLRPGLPGLFPL